MKRNTPLTLIKGFRILVSRTVRQCSDCVLGFEAKLRPPNLVQQQQQQPCTAHGFQRCNFNFFRSRFGRSVPAAVAAAAAATALGQRWLVGGARCPPWRLFSPGLLELCIGDSWIGYSTKKEKHTVSREHFLHIIIEFQRGQ